MSLKVTVGIPTMNNADTIDTTLHQLLEGTRPPDRIIIVDASTDETPSIIERIAVQTDVPIDLFRQPDYGRGVGAARQEIYERFEGDLLACLDTDRRVTENWLEKRVAFHESNPGIDVLSAAQFETIDEQVTSPKTPYFFQQANATIRAETLDAVDGWDKWLPRGEDWDMQIRLWKSGATAYARGDLYGESMGDDTALDRLNAFRSRPSSVAFLRKYGTWYARFHPLHPLGDILSGVASLALLATVSLLFIAPVAASLSAGFVVLLMGAYLYFSHIRNRDAILTRQGPVFLARFFLLSITALRELVFEEDYPWNYGGFEGSDER